MDMTYYSLDTSELQGSTQADYLIAFDADLQVVAGQETVHEELGFPVVELARSLRIWLAEPNRGDFEFDSMSFEAVGSVAFRHTAAGWTFGSVFNPGGPPVALDWGDVESCCRRLISQVEEDLARLGLDPEDVLKR